MESATTGQGADAPQTKYAHNALGQRVFKTEPQYRTRPKSSAATLNNVLGGSGEDHEDEPRGFIEQIKDLWSKLWSPATRDSEKLGYSFVYADNGTLLGEYGAGGSNSTGAAQYIFLETAIGPMSIAAMIKITDCLASHAAYRDSFAYILKTTPDQESKMREKNLKYRVTPLPDPRKDPYGAAREKFATRTQSALEAGGITLILNPYISPFPRDTWRLAIDNAEVMIVIPKGGIIPSEFSFFNK